MALIFIGLNVLDVIITRLSLNSGAFYEGNPIMRLLNTDMWIKVGLSILAVALIYKFSKKPQRMMRLLNIIIAGIVVWNLSWYLVYLGVSA